MAEQQVVSLQRGADMMPHVNGGPTENTVNVLLNFEIKEVWGLKPEKSQS